MPLLQEQIEDGEPPDVLVQQECGNRLVGSLRDGDDFGVGKFCQGSDETFPDGRAVFCQDGGKRHLAAL